MELYTTLCAQAPQNACMFVSEATLMTRNVNLIELYIEWHESIIASNGGHNQEGCQH
jgi:hypothetical protein